MMITAVIEEMEVTVKGSSMICPAQPTPNGTLWLSNLDVQLLGSSHTPSLHFHKPNGSSDFFKPQVLKEALSKTLVPYYPMAGRFGYDENGRLQIICNAEGALWVEAETTSALDDLGDFTPNPKLRKLFPTVDYSGDVTSYPLVIAQLTTFKCGGVCLCIATHHTVNDGTAAYHFINSWSEMARGLSQISLPPLIDRTLLRARLPPTPKFHHVEYDPPPSLNTSMSLGPNSKPTSLSIFKITQNQLNTLKAKLFHKENNKTRYTTFTILAAHMWRCATKARGLLGDQPTKLRMPINGRPRLHPHLPSSYLGNVFFTAASIALSGDLQSEPFINTVERVHGALQRMDNEYLRSTIDYLETSSNLTTVPKKFQCPNLHINNLMRFPLYDADFGWGRPIYVGPINIVDDGRIYLLPRESDDGSVSIMACLETSHMKLFEKHLYEGLMSSDKIKDQY